MVIILTIDYRHFERFAPLIYIASLLSLVATLWIAPEIRGTRAWLFEGRFQPSEFAKIALVLVMARHFHRNPPEAHAGLRQLIRPLLIAAPPVALIVAQDRKSTRLNSSHVVISYAVFCLKKNIPPTPPPHTPTPTKYLPSD